MSYTEMVLSGKIAKMNERLNKIEQMLQIQKWPETLTDTPVPVPMAQRHEIQLMAVFGKRINIKLSREEFVFFTDLIRSWIYSIDIASYSDVEGMAILQGVLKLYEKKLRQSIIINKGKSITIDLTQARVITEVINTMQLRNLPYEHNIINKVLAQIDQQL